MPHHIREAQSADYPQIVSLVKELADIDSDYCPLDEDYLRRYLAWGRNGILIAESDGAVAGMLSYSFRADLYHSGKVAFIEVLIIHHPFRGRGLGSALLEEFFRRAEAACCVEVSVSCMPANAGAQKLYRSHGLVDQEVLLQRHFQ
jgi:ribosomal protein S18 acetylase RimI-like enzyme